jgi:phage virion morphogenesis protein
MSGFSIAVDDRAVTAALRALQARVRSPGAAMKSIGQAIVTATDLSFRAEEDPWGASWARLSAATLARRRGASAQILRDTGRLANSISYRAGKDSVAVGTNVIYAAVHQFGAAKGAFGRTRRGAPIPWGRIPARPFLPMRASGVDLPQDLLEEVLGIVRAHLEAAR